jgi:hypothetical protein
MLHCNDELYENTVDGRSAMCEDAIRQSCRTEFNAMNEQINANDLLKIISEQKALIEKQQTALENAAKPRALTIKVSDKGCVSVYGGKLRKFGASFYASEWQTILDASKDIQAFIAQNKHLLSYKA